MKHSFPLLMVCIAVLISLHQFFVYGVIFELKDLHHETWILCALALALGWVSGLKRRAKLRK